MNNYICKSFRKRDENNITMRHKASINPTKPVSLTEQGLNKFRI